jgi:capsule polysaccharide export protein KpsE/RkpR
MSTAPQERQERKVTLVLDDDSFLEPSAPESARSFIEIATELARRKRFLAALTLGAGVLGAAVSLILPLRFTAETRILPPQQQAQSSAAILLSTLAGGNSGLGSLASAAGVSLKTPNDLYIGMLKSRPVSDAMIRRFDLIKVYGAKDMYDARLALKKKTDIVAEKDGMISIAVEDRDKARAAAMANGYVEELRNLTKGLAITEASQRRLFYEDQLKQAKDELAVAEIALKQAQEKSGMIQLDAQAKAIIEGIGELRARIVAKQVEVQALRSYSTEQNAQLNIAESELAGMQSELKRLEQTNGSSVFDLSLKNIPEAGMAYIRATREFKYRETLYELMAKQYEIARLDEARDAALIQVVAPAIEPERKSFPPRTLITLLSAFTGLFLACLWVMLGQWHANVQADPVRAAQLKAFRAAVTGK